MPSPIRQIFSLLLGLFLLIVGHGLQISLIPLRAAAEHWSQVEIGAIGSAYYVGFLIGCIGAPYLIRRSGHIRGFAALVALVSSAMVLHPLIVTFPVWFALRLVLGFSLAGVYMIMESWVNERASNTNRGLLMAVYIMVNYGALAIGQFMVTLYSPLQFSLFAIATVFMSLSAIPLALTRLPQPAPIAIVRFRPLALYRLSPVGFVGVTISGIANGAFWSLGVVAAVGAGMPVPEAAVFMGIATAAGAFAQWPAGRISDRIDRRLVLIGLLVAAAVFGLALAFLPIAGVGWFVLAALFGMAIAPTYSVAAAHAYDFSPNDAMVETAAGLFLVNSVGAIVGPLVAAAAMQTLGAPRLFLFTALLHTGLAAYIYTRVRVRKPLPEALKTDFELGATGPAGTGIAPEPPETGTETPPEAVEAAAAPAESAADADGAAPSETTAAP